jgi:hypothetical protein
LHGYILLANKFDAVLTHCIALTCNLKTCQGLMEIFIIWVVRVDAKLIIVWVNAKQLHSVHNLTTKIIIHMKSMSTNYNDKTHQGWGKNVLFGIRC